MTAVIGAMSEAQEVESLSFLRVPMPSRQADKWAAYSIAPWAAPRYPIRIRTRKRHRLPWHSASLVCLLISMLQIDNLSTGNTQSTISKQRMAYVRFPFLSLLCLHAIIPWGGATV